MKQPILNNSVFNCFRIPHFLAYLVGNTQLIGCGIRRITALAMNFFIGAYHNKINIKIPYARK